MTRTAFALAIITFALASPAASAGSRLSHHGGIILNCEPPHFFDQTPGKDAKVAAVQDFSLTASDNTDRDTVKVWANNEPVEVSVTPQRSGQFLIQGRLKAPVASGKVWFRVNAESNDGCDENSAWNVYAGH